ncbi:4-coumarate--CoA ligase-like 7 [Mycena sanguinolenta]|uniref:4-coumarate--CoA ligase-like 7 n=1 Tax=Mycena sanguinolenta TaxID=230812 RepID=A0A8H6Y2F5_9AGAR|nr:4-coumarate--CoA ligase-like 7 [Mycena sanguinolenta]
MAPQIYTSPYPSFPIHSTSVFTRLFASRGSGDIGGFSGSLKAFVDADSGASITRAELVQLTLSFAYGLKNHPTTSLFATRGSTVLIFSPNSLAWPVVLFGSVAAGLRCTLANSAYTSAELAFQYNDSGARLILTTEDGLSVVREMFAELGLGKEEAEKRIIVLGQDLRWAGGPSAPASPASKGLLRMEDLLNRGKLDQEEKFEGSNAHETVYICYSSGTTGKPKGVETTHQNMTTLLDIVSPAFPPMTGDTVMLGILPFYHIYGIAKLVHFPFSQGCPVIIQTRFDPVKFCAAIQKYRVTLSLIVPPVLVVLARHPAVDEYDLSSVNLLFSGAAPLGRSLAQQVKDRLLSKRKGPTKLAVTQGIVCPPLSSSHMLRFAGYGLTETSPTTHVLAAEDADRKMGSIGPLLPNLEARLVEDDEGKIDAAEGQPGELWGYLNNPVATKNSITPDGWFKTGDVAIRDKDGYYYIVDRRKELIKYKGFQVPPAELESVLLTHPDIADVAVIGLESVKEATELPRAYVVHAHPEKVKSAAAKAEFARSVAKWMESKVARHKFLRGGVGVIDIIPKSAAGKILRRNLRELAKQEAARGDLGLDVKARL